MGLISKWLGRAARVAAKDDVPGIDIEALRSQWERQGFAVLPGFYSARELDRAESVLEEAWRTRAPRIVVDNLNTGARTRLMDVDEEARASHRFKTNDLFLEYEAIRELALNPRITPVLTRLLGHVPVLCNSLTFQQGSSQPDHVDALYMTPRSPHHLIAIWVALEDCHVDAGPLRYYSGSHTIPPYVFTTGSNHVVDTEMEQWNAYMAREVEGRGLKPETFAARRGDVFIWSAYLLHGGSPIHDPEMTRRSVVFHYYSESDCISNRCTLVPAAGGYWMHRAHQHVPGIDAPEAPPLPADARVADEMRT